uniref:Uncharacterized protein LOC114339481 n=1 Tax=Diabrotica virgifera virgifera TaxID=50390 RepID=A0A6P7GJ15_DIAVI
MQIQASSTANRNCLQEKTSEAEYHNQKGVSIEFVGCDENDLQAIAITDITFSNVNETNDITFEVDDLFNDNIEPNARSESENITMEFDIANNIEIENIDESLANETDTDYVPLVEYSSTDSDVEPTENKTNESRKRSRSQRGKAKKIHGFSRKTKLKGYRGKNTLAEEKLKRGKLFLIKKVNEKK